MTADKASREGNMGELYETTKKSEGKYRKPERPAKNKEGRSHTEAQGRQNKWVEHFEELLNKPVLLNPPDTEVVYTDLSTDDTRTTGETNKAIKQIKSATEEGPNSIRPETLDQDIENHHRHREETSFRMKKSARDAGAGLDILQKPSNWITKQALTRNTQGERSQTKERIVPRIGGGYQKNG
ncbi:unnamed protein product [Schistosoma curassoni]|uniref:HABP4_PAI-RBP1 domain-containing protein n=1 Tax=Schistosoma curassoni TaxID=6186 RepID=A0A183KSC4_9TREM|nr:unnamed protein product [Schistosoma curassoni]